MNPRRFPVTGRFAPKPLSERAPLLAKMLIPDKSPAHLKGWQTRREKRAAWVKAHCEALRRSMTNG